MPGTLHIAYQHSDQMTAAQDLSGYAALTEHGSNAYA